ncbi:MAG TPA: hypothetical protein VK590_03665 [Saprospiraceae bacterium]|nr:hypothetical protein [Saprospiraceae bacterium]
MKANEPKMNINFDKKSHTKVKTPLYVLAPGGYRIQTLVKRAPKSKNSRIALFEKMNFIKPSNAAIQRQKLLKNPSTFIDNFGPPTADTLNQNWVAYAGWNNSTGRTISRFTTQCIVPPKPVIGYQTIFIFMGIQSTYRILQPVLQWGFSKMGGGDYWSIGSCYAGGQNDDVYFLNDMIRVEPGQELLAVIELHDRNNEGIIYNCYFQGFPQTFLPTPKRIPELKSYCVTLESYHVSNRNEYPNAAAISISNINIIDINNRSILPQWNIPNRSGLLGEHAILLRNIPEPDQIDLYY